MQFKHVFVLIFLCGCGGYVVDGASGTELPCVDGGGGTGGVTIVIPPCEPIGCDPLDCGTIDDGCGGTVDCDANIGCFSELGGDGFGSPMTCNAATHRCECKPGDDPLAFDACMGETAILPVYQFCKEYGGCYPAYCGIPPVPKLADECVFSGTTWGDNPIWCCVTL